MADIATYEMSSSTGVDVIVMDAFTGLVGITAWTECADGTSTVGTDPNVYCRPQWLRYDLADTSDKDELNAHY